MDLWGQTNGANECKTNGASVGGERWGWRGEERREERGGEEGGESGGEERACEPSSSADSCHASPPHPCTEVSSLNTSRGETK